MPDARPLAFEVLQLRAWQLSVNELLKKKQFQVPVHLAMGHEALAVAIHHAMASNDLLVLTHRNIAYNLARCGSLQPILDEFAGLASGAARGRLGSMNLAQPEKGVIYTSSILGNNLPVACGLAMAAVAGQMVWVLTGDGAMEEGAFYESLVFARSHDLRIVIVVENNDHSLASTIDERRCSIDLAGLCESLAIPYLGLEGNEPVVYLNRLNQIRHLAEVSGPCCVEAMLTTLNQHAGPTPGWPGDPKNISLSSWPAIELSDRDPAFVAARHLTENDLAQWESHA